MHKQYTAEWGHVAAVHDVSFEVPAGQLLTLLGPSGCGKTTTLRCIAGLERPDGGEIALGDRLVFSGERRVMVPPHKRRIGMVFQSYAIWPHMSVFENVAFPLKGTGLNRADLEARVKRALELVDLGGLAARPATQLSGGQQQRVALARALVAEPEVLLLDEPLSNLDAKLRESTRLELRALQQRLGITAVYVTHDQAEALAISDLVAVMNGGSLLELDTPRGLYERPRYRFTAEFVGSANLLPIEAGVEPLGDGLLRAACPLGPVVFGTQVSGADHERASFLTVRPEHLALLQAPPAERINVWPGRVAHVTFLGSYTEYVVSVQASTLRAQVTGAPELLPRQEVFVHIPPRRCVVVSDGDAAAAQAG